MLFTPNRDLCAETHHTYVFMAAGIIVLPLQLCMYVRGGSYLGFPLWKLRPGCYQPFDWCSLQSSNHRQSCVQTVQITQLLDDIYEFDQCLRSLGDRCSLSENGALCPQGQAVEPVYAVFDPGGLFRGTYRLSVVMELLELKHKKV